jgi:hypothetical protein
MMLFVGTSSFAQPGPAAGPNSSMVGQTGTQNAVVHQTVTELQIKQMVITMMLSCIKS